MAASTIVAKEGLHSKAKEGGRGDGEKSFLIKMPARAATTHPPAILTKILLTAR